MISRRSATNEETRVGSSDNVRTLFNYENQFDWFSERWKASLLLKTCQYVFYYRVRKDFFSEVLIIKTLSLCFCYRVWKHVSVFWMLRDLVTYKNMSVCFLLSLMKTFLFMFSKCWRSFSGFRNDSSVRLRKRRIIMIIRAKKGLGGRKRASGGENSRFRGVGREKWCFPGSHRGNG